MTDHDQRFKILLREFFAHFFQLFFAAWAGRFDFDKIEWLTQDVFTDPPQGKTYDVDLLAKLPVRQAVAPTAGGQAYWLVLVHVEVESADKVAPLRPRMFHYYEHLRRLFDLPVLPIGLYLRVGLNGVGWDEYEEKFWEETLLRFRYAYVGLPALDAEQYLHGDNWLGVALTALMRVSPERRLELAEEAWRRLAKCPENEYHRYLLCECMEAYTPLEEAQLRAFEDWLRRDSDSGVHTMSMGLFEKYRKEGRDEGQRQSLKLVLEGKFGSLSEQTEQRLEQLPAERLKQLLALAGKAQSLQELGLAD